MRQSEKSNLHVIRAPKEKEKRDFGRSRGNGNFPKLTEDSTDILKSLQPSSKINIKKTTLPSKHQGEQTY